MVETGVTIIAASVPFLRLLIVEARPSREHRPYTPELKSPKEIGRRAGSLYETIRLRAVSGDHEARLCGQLRPR
jgi:hypothetical protein